MEFTVKDKMVLPEYIIICVNKNAVYLSNKKTLNKLKQLPEERGH